MNGYCGYGDWPACVGPESLAITGQDGLTIIVLAAIAVAAIFVGALELWRNRR